MGLFHMQCISFCAVQLVIQVLIAFRLTHEVVSVLENTVRSSFECYTVGFVHTLPLTIRDCQSDSLLVSIHPHRFWSNTTCSPLYNVIDCNGVSPGAKSTAGAELSFIEEVFSFSSLSLLAFEKESSPGENSEQSWGCYKLCRFISAHLPAPGP